MSASRRRTRPGSSRSRAGRRCSRCGAPGPRTFRTSRSRSRSCGPARSREEPSIRTSSGASGCASIPSYEVPYEHPSLEPVLRETLGTIIFQDQVLEVAIAFAGFSPGEAEGLRRAMSRKRSEAAIEAHHKRFVAGAQAAARRRRGDRRAGVRDGSGVLGLRLSEGPRRRVRAACLPVDVAARPLRPGVPVLAAQRAADGLLSPDALVHEAQRRGIEVLPPDVNESGAECDMEARRHAGGEDAGSGRVRIGLGYVRGRSRAGGQGTGIRARGRAGGFARCRTSRRGRARARRRWSCWRGRERATRSVAGGAEQCGSARIALWQLGWRRPAGRFREARSWRCPLDLPAPPEAATGCRRGRRCSPTTARRA